MPPRRMSNMLTAVAVVFLYLTYMEHYVTYNCMTAAHPGRLNDIEEELSWTAGFGLQGTRYKQNAEQPLSSWSSNKFDYYSAGYGGPGSNRHAGVLLALNKKKHKKDGLAMAWPEHPKLQGRAIAVRSRRRHSDITFVVCYLPPCDRQQNTRTITNMMFDWLRKLVQGLPSRTTPLLLMDANAKTGYVVAQGLRNITISSAVGARQPEQENENGEKLRGFCVDNQITLTNTFVSAGPTYFAGTMTGYSSRIDYVATTYAAWHAGIFVNPRTLIRTARKLQHTRARRLVDHVPLAITLKCGDLRKLLQRNVKSLRLSRTGAISVQK
eukprot:TRINITY_DN3761_c0_g1_i5.p1 TRINITY_DN3761_c0_g1~~TRINITY_DN3761_c0_g1_i5.p1  ORF type:complete len:325 (-),score=41.98 TRINITY_DN3761_c0_g1_i5:1382-2356(-)